MWPETQILKLRALRFKDPFTPCLGPVGVTKPMRLFLSLNDETAETVELYMAWQIRISR